QLTGVIMPNKPTVDVSNGVKRTGTSVIFISAPSGTTSPDTTTVQSVQDFTNGISFTHDANIIANGKKLQVTLTSNAQGGLAPGGHAPIGMLAADQALEGAADPLDRGLALAGASPTGTLSIELGGTGPTIDSSCSSPPFTYSN
ncbi:MAG: hypothetical protein ACKPEY_18705, partial [Planctomycetota bacterium]